METREYMELKFPSASEKFLYVYGTFKSKEEKPYIRMRYLRLFFTSVMVQHCKQVCIFSMSTPMLKALIP